MFLKYADTEETEIIDVGYTSKESSLANINEEILYASEINLQVQICRPFYTLLRAS